MTIHERLSTRATNTLALVLTQKEVQLIVAKGGAKIPPAAVCKALKMRDQRPNDTATLANITHHFDNMATGIIRCAIIML